MKSDPIILASTSPRRAELLRSLGLNFAVVPSEAEELHDEKMPVIELCETNARLKAQEVALRFPAHLVIGADTLVARNGRIFGKPRDLDHARSMLQELSGRTHEVITGVCLVQGAKTRLFSDRTQVTFRNLRPADIEEYVQLVPVLDKAGSYGIQERGEMLVESIAGSFHNVMGFPTERFLQEWELGNAIPPR